MFAVPVPHVSTDGVDSTASAAVIAAARRRQRRRRFAIAVFAVAAAATFGIVSQRGGGSGNSAAVAGQTSSPATAAACLQRHLIIVSPARSSVDFNSAPAIQVSYALVPGQRLSNATVYFERTPSDANMVVAKLVQRFKAADPTVRAYFTVAGNAVAFWNAHHPSAAVAATLQRCL